MLPTTQNNGELLDSDSADSRNLEYINSSPLSANLQSSTRPRARPDPKSYIFRYLDKPKGLNNNAEFCIEGLDLEGKNMRIEFRKDCDPKFRTYPFEYNEIYEIQNVLLHKCDPIFIIRAKKGTMIKKSLGDDLNIPKEPNRIVIKNLCILPNKMEVEKDYDFLGRIEFVKEIKETKKNDKIIPAGKKIHLLLPSKLVAVFPIWGKLAKEFNAQEGELVLFKFMQRKTEGGLKATNNTIFYKQEDIMHLSEAKGFEQFRLPKELEPDFDQIVKMRINEKTSEVVKFYIDEIDENQLTYERCTKDECRKKVTDRKCKDGHISDEPIPTFKLKIEAVDDYGISQTIIVFGEKGKVILGYDAEDVHKWAKIGQMETIRNAIERAKDEAFWFEIYRSQNSESKSTLLEWKAYEVLPVTKSKGSR